MPNKTRKPYKFHEVCLHNGKEGNDAHWETKWTTHSFASARRQALIIARSHPNQEVTIFSRYTDDGTLAGDPETYTIIARTN